MKTAMAKNLPDLIGETPLLRVPSLSSLTGCEILIKCEYFNPGGSIKDRAAWNMVQEALESGALKPGMTIIEGTAGNTGIGLAIAAKAVGCQMRVVMPKGQTPEKERMIALHGAELHLVDAVPFANQNHFYHTARRIAEADPNQYWWANQFENLGNFRAHYQGTGPEIWSQTEGRIDALVSAAGTGGTIGGTSAYLKEQDANIQVILADPEGSGLCQYVKTGEFKSSGSSLTEGIGIMRLVANFAKARVDQALTITDQELVSVAHYVRLQDALVLGSSSALNLAAALQTALRMGPGHRIVTFACDLGERSFSKLYQAEFLASKNLNAAPEGFKSLMQNYQARWAI
ncbi:cysteine synthase A [bacterium (Candidatus Blackallbacteria) CG17_big_fil_post_rev_8_21_14_2_50_48_46]|uniref:Cysteine synthase A n=1 Tax=bacterium (Candidatus Blackallbacteria) CG17_big_fil_post_rev_8_21_14_2_50_48_46 TaxID=2014261 RepID=A0A2M7G4U8_9BACT|nr:MAG: cysteine synthase A [bacterium (Candidatus Blackallbacteria) CG18_big_fil_WC_8_21_14_2_50_49_26]PIW16966.1 MAG: cysteine synthase A [bacterium (Candidatus Blackallbacteria) CG17_big_fil_post_rev_8_21_14_2_50_48_46]PIW50245.1 MAG: cysteine synthase A [bacterium (Candidatus Blackallbacteria) CG13_big_fil_rev_8_21_14_2_50_49_14]